MVTPFIKFHGEQPGYNNLKVFGCRCFHILRVTISSVQRLILMCSLGTTTYTKYINAIIPLQGGFTYPDMLCLMKTHYPMCIQSNLRPTLMSHHLLLLLNLSLNYRHMIIMIQGKYRMLAHITSDNGATPHVLIDYESIIDLSGA